MNTDRSLNYGVLGGAVATVLVWVLSLFQVDVPAEVGVAIGTVVTWLVAALIPAAKAGQ